MSKRMLLLFGLVVLLLPAGLRAELAKAPDPLATSDWNSIRAEYERHRHAAFPTEKGHRVRNFAQGWVADFDRRGFTLTPDDNDWSWGLELTSYGWVEQARRVASPPGVTAGTQRISYDWDDTLEEWFVNDKRGLEHGFTIRRRPRGAGETLELNLTVRGDLKARIHNGGRSVAFFDQEGRTALTYAGLKAWDADGRGLDARMEAVDAGLRLLLETAGARYPLMIDPIAQQAYLKASNAEETDLFGQAVAISGDTVVVSAPFESSAATGVNGDQGDNSVERSGAVYVFVRENGEWRQQAYLKASNTDRDDGFGANQALAISGDTIVVGALHENSNSKGVNGDQNNWITDSVGAAYVFVRENGEWSQQAYLKASNTHKSLGLDFVDTGDRFGISVDVSGDTIVVGAAGEDSNATGVNGDENNNTVSSAGAAYVFVRENGVWRQQAFVKPSSTPNVEESFGISVSVSGDTIVVGAPGEDSNATGVNGDESNNDSMDAGAAYVFVRENGAWRQQAYLKASNTEPSKGPRQFGDNFGLRVAISGDTIVVGAQFEQSSATEVNGQEDDNGANESGAAYVFVRENGEWSQQAYLKASNADPGDRFGNAVAIEHDSIVVGAFDEMSLATGVNGDQTDNSGQRAGAAYLFVRERGRWSQRAYLKSTNHETRDFFGSSVAISEDTVVVGAVLEDGAATSVVDNNNLAENAGAAYVFHIPPPPFTSDGLVHSARLEAGDVAEQEIVSLFGSRLADFDEDAVLPLGTQLGGASVDVTDSQGVTRPCLMFAARVETEGSPSQLNFMIPEGTAIGLATLTVRRASGDSHSIAINVVEVAPGIFTANSSGSGPPAASALRFAGNQLVEASFVFDVSSFPFEAAPIDLGSESDQVFLSLFATGIRNGRDVEVTIGGVTMTTVFGPAPSSEFAGLDQLNVLLDRSLIGRGLVDVLVTVDGIAANVVQINIR